jgi:7-cyano-7-deazaguanine synthase in queuosine biosynthesis
LLGFLSGDEWTIEFRKEEPPNEVVHDVPGAYRRAVLLSGGADSAIGALTSRHELGENPHALVSHYGPTALPPIQRDVAANIESLLSGPQQLHQQINFSRRNKQPNGVWLSNEFSTRARSLMFLALGLAVASVQKCELWVPENGFASLNPPLGPDRRGSLSTRTTHPRLLTDLPAILAEVGVHANLRNPFALDTKGEMFRRAADLVGVDAASEFLSRTHSCAHTGHRSLGLSIKYQCGVCFGCTVRRAAFVAAGLEDRTEYLLGKLEHPGVADYLAGKSVERSIRAFVEKGIGPADIAAMSLPDSYPGKTALDLCERQVKEFQGLFA